MEPASRNYVKVVVGVVLALICVSLAAVVGYLHGKARAERLAEVQVANDDAFYSLFALQAMRDPTNQQLRTLFQASLDGAAIKLSEACLRDPELIGATNYNLLVKIQKHLKEHGRDSDRNPALRPVDQVMAKIAEATARMESIHPDVRQWEEAEDAHVTAQRRPP